MASAFAPEISEGMAEAELPPINIINLVLEVESATSDSAKVLAGYDSDFPVEAHLELRFTVDKRDGKWVISNAEAVNVVRKEGIVVQVLDEDGAPIGGLVSL